MCRSGHSPLTIAKMSGIFSKKRIGILIVGLHGAGKTTILSQLELGSIVFIYHPPIRFNLETDVIEWKNFTFTVWDCGSQDPRPPIWPKYVENIKGVIFVVDSSDRDRVAEAREELHLMMNEQVLRKVTLLVFANKQDLPTAMTAGELTDELALHSLGQQHWFVQSSCAHSKEGLYDGLEWMSKHLT